MRLSIMTRKTYRSRSCIARPGDETVATTEDISCREGEADAGGFEPIWRNNELAGFVTSGGYGHTIRKSFAMGYIRSEFLNDKTAFEISILGERRPVTILGEPAYDPTGKRMRC